jgi:hypothetical protein
MFRAISPHKLRLDHDRFLLLLETVEANSSRSARKHKSEQHELVPRSKITTARDERLAKLFNDTYIIVGLVSPVDHGGVAGCFLPTCGGHARHARSDLACTMLVVRVGHISGRSATKVGNLERQAGTRAEELQTARLALATDRFARAVYKELLPCMS